MLKTDAPIVVGVDDTGAGRAALAVAMNEASRRGVALDVVTAWTAQRLVSVPSAGTAGELERARAQGVQDGAVAQVLRRMAGYPTLSRQVVEGDPAGVLLAMARSAVYLVLGAGGGVFGEDWGLGSVAAQCIRSAPCPVLIVPRPMRRSRQERMSR